MALSDQLEELARKHGATSYRNRADTQNPAYGFTPAGLLNLIAEVTGEMRKQDEALIRQMMEALECCYDVAENPCGGITTQGTAILAARAWLEGKP